VPVRGGIVLHLDRMNRILDVDLDNRTVTCERAVGRTISTNASKATGSSTPAIR